MLHAIRSHAKPIAIGLVLAVAVAIAVIMNPGDPPKRVSGAMRSLDFWSAARAYPNAVVPDIGISLAFEETQRMRAGNAGGIDDLVDPWVPMGPHNIGGRTLALAIHPEDPSVMYAGSASGGLWVTTVGGVGADAWDYVETGHPVLGVSTIAIDSADPDVMYIGTGEVYAYQDALGGEVDRTTRGSYGIGVLKTLDGGATWTKSLDWEYAQSRGVWAVRIHPTDSSIVYAGTTEGVFKSTDAGATWELVLDVIMVMDLRIHPGNPSILIAACGNFGSTGHGLYRTVDGGITWNQLTTGLPASWTGKAQLGFAPSSPNIVFASIADTFAGRGLYKSTNTGDSWTRISTTDFQQWQGWYSHWVLVSPFDPNLVLVGGIEIWRSLTGGSNLQQRSDWTQFYFGTPPPEGPIGDLQYAHADHHYAVWHPTDPATVFFASDGGVFKTINTATTFSSLIGGYQTTQFYNGFANSGTNPNRAIGGLQDNFTAIYDGGVAWRRVIGGDGCWAGINQINDNTMYGSYQNLGMQRSRDGFASWNGVAPPNIGTTAFVAPFVVSPSSPSVLYAGRSYVFRSANEGSGWTTTNGSSPLNGSNPVLVMDMSHTDDDKVYAATPPISGPAAVFRTTNGGTTWDDITGSLPDRYPGDIAVDPTNDDVVYITFMGFGSPHVFKSIDAGDTWDDVTANLPDLPTSAVIVDPDYPEAVYVGNDLGVFVSIDGGNWWQPFMLGMQPSMINDLKVFQPDRLLRAATHGSGTFERDLVDPTVAVGDGPVAGVTPGVALRVAPNPLRADSRVSFELPEAGRVRVSVFDVSGRQVVSLLDRELPAGSHSVPLSPDRLASGVFYVRMETAREVAMTRIVYMR